MVVVCLSVSCLTLSRERKGVASWKLTERKRKPVTRVTCNPIMRSKGEIKVKVIKPLNVVTENQLYLRKRKAYELETWYTDGVRRPTSPTCAVTSNLTTLGGCSSRHFVRGGEYCGGCTTTGRTACFVYVELLMCLSINQSIYLHQTTWIHITIKENTRKW